MIQKRAHDHHDHCMDNCENGPPSCEDHCNHQHDQEMHHCKDDDQECKDRADDHLKHCLDHCDNEPGPPTCDTCEERFASEVDRCGDNAQCIADAERRYRDCMGRCEEGFNFKGDKPSCKEACAKYAAGAAKKNCKADDKECMMKFKKMAGACMEKKCSQQKPSCEDACAAKAKAGAKQNCKKDDKECLAKFKAMAGKCMEQKCKAEKPKKGSCEDDCVDYYTEAAKKSCKKDDKECINKFKKMAAKMTALTTTLKLPRNHVKRTTKNASINSRR